MSDVFRSIVKENGRLYREVEEAQDKLAETRSKDVVHVANVVKTYDPDYKKRPRKKKKI